MINILLTVDEADKELGNFFESCATKIEKLFIMNTSIIKINSNMLQNDIMINQRIAEIKNNFILIALTHGSDDELTGSKNISYVEVGRNVTQFQRAFFYCFSCNTAKILGKEVIAHGAKCFVGHNREIYANNIGIWKDLFSRPIIYFWSRFLTGNSIISCVKAKKEEYTRIIDEIYNTDIIHAACLLCNRDSLVIYGNGNCSMKDFS